MIMPNFIPAFTAKSRVFHEGCKFQFTFFCDICEKGYCSSLVYASNAREALQQAEEEARLYFNWCPRCNKWVCDKHFNENKEACILCAPRICAACGAYVPQGNQFCMACGVVQYESRKREE